MVLQGEPLAAPVDSLGAAVTLWAAVRAAHAGARGQRFGSKDRAPGRPRRQAGAALPAAGRRRSAVPRPRQVGFKKLWTHGYVDSHMARLNGVARDGLQPPVCHRPPQAAKLRQGWATPQMPQRLGCQHEAGRTTDVPDSEANMRHSKTILWRRLLAGIQLSDDAQLPADMPSLVAAQVAAAEERASSPHADVINSFFELQAGPCFTVCQLVTSAMPCSRDRLCRQTRVDSSLTLWSAIHNAEEASATCIQMCSMSTKGGLTTTLNLVWHLLQLQLQPELEGTLERGALLRANGEELAAQHTRPARAELALNPSRFESWEMYAGD